MQSNVARCSRSLENKCYSSGGCTGLKIHSTYDSVVLLEEQIHHFIEQTKFGECLSQVLSFTEISLVGTGYI